MALISTLLLSLLGGVSDLGRAFYDYIILLNASREGARYASQFPRLQDAADIRAIVKQEALNNGLTLSDADIAIEGLGDAAGRPIRVIITYRFSTFLSEVIGVGDVTLRSSTEMVIFGLN